MKISDKNKILLNKTNIVALCGCLLSAYLSPFRNALVDVYGVLKGIFPFSTIGAHAAIAENSNAVISQLTYVWIIFLPYVAWIMVQSKRVCHIKNIHDPDRRGGILFALFLGLVAPLFGLLYASAEPSFCRGCEYGNQITGGVIRLGFMWLFGFMLGQAIVFIVNRKS